MTRYYEDLSVGDRYETGGYTLTKAEIVSFAERYDPQPFHVDEDAAADSMFGELIASGLQTLCLSMRLYTTEFLQGDEEVAIMGGAGMDELRFHDPVYPSDTLRVGIEILEKTPSESRADRGYVDVRLGSFVDETEVMSVIAHVIVGRDAASE